MSWIILILIIPAICHTETPRVQHHLGSVDAKAAFLPYWTDVTINQSSSAPVSIPVSGCKDVQGHYKGSQQMLHGKHLKIIWKTIHISITDSF